MFRRIAKSKLTRITAVYLIINLLFELFVPMHVLALTGGPSQPEVQSFEPVGTSEMVQLSTGDFVYNIPLLDVDGYPVNISYHSGIGMDQEASWVGLGWNINPGAITRSMRGIPDDYSGQEKINQEINLRPNTTFGAGIGEGIEVFGYGGSASAGMFWNSYKGLGIDLFMDFSIPTLLGTTLTTNLNYNTQEGIEISPQLSLSVPTAVGASIGVGAVYSSREGLKALTLSKSVSATIGLKSGGSISAGAGNISYVPMGTQSWIPNYQFPRYFLSGNATFKTGPFFNSVFAFYLMRGHYSRQSLLFKEKKLPAFGYLF
jgi:hypothetical protein